MGREQDREERVFGRDSAAWRVAREMGLLAGGPAAAVLQAAHPVIAHGVGRYSGFREDAFGRLRHTLDAVWAITFGTKAEAEVIRELLAERHARIRLPVGLREAMHAELRRMGMEPAPVTERGPEWAAGLDPDAQLWVLATLMVGAVEGWERMHGAMPTDLREAYCQDSRVFGAYFGLPRDYGPQGWAGLRGYYDRMIEGDWLGSDPLSREIAAGVAHPRRPWWLRAALSPMGSVLISEFIPAPLNTRLGFPSTLARRLRFRMLRGGLRAARWFPAGVRFAPAYRRAVGGEAQGKSGKLTKKR